MHKAVDKIEFSPWPLLLGWIFALVIPCHADNVGITTARLIETATGSYVLEVDSSPTLLPAFAAPVLPERFESSLTTEYDKQSRFVMIKYCFAYPELPLTATDEILLPWGQMGVSLTAQWADGQFHRALFLRRLDGIPVPIRLLRTGDIPRTVLFKQKLLAGMHAAVWGLNSWLIILCLACMLHRPYRLSVLMVTLAGLWGSLLLADLGLVRLQPAILQSLIALGLVLLARALIKHENAIACTCRLLFATALLAGCLPLAQDTVDLSQRLAAGFLFQLGWGSVVLLMALGLAPLLRTAKERRQNLTLAGVLAMAATLGYFVQGVTPARESSQQVLERVTAAQMALPGAPASRSLSGGGLRPQPTTQLEDPLAGFMSIEPYETRLEILVKVSETRNWPGLSVPETVLPVASQEAYRQALAGLLRESVTLRQDANSLTPTSIQSHFVTLGPYGVFTRPEPMPEPVPAAILGVTMSYPHDGLPMETEVAWQFFADNLETIRFTVTDPFGVRQGDVTRTAPRFVWQNKLTGYQPPEVVPVALVVPHAPLLSLGLLGMSALMMWRLRSPLSRRTAGLLLLTAYGTYPFLRTPMTWGGSGMLKPSRVEAKLLLDDLLTNVYRAFDYRQEEAVYDRLALTVTGDQLTDIYLQSRKALEMENRGAARGRVDDVDVLEVLSVQKASSGAYAVNVKWTVSGSVSHFGHTHYRRNLNHAVVTLDPREGYWHICGINVIDEERLL